MPATDSNIFVSREPVPLEPPKDLRDYVAPIRLHKFLVIGSALLGLMGGWLFAARGTPSYSSEVQILVGPGISDPTSPITGDLASTIAMTTEGDIATSRAVARAARETLGTDEPVDDLLEKVSQAFGLGSTVLTLTFTDDTPELAKAGAAAFASAYLDFRAAPLETSLEERTNALNEQVDELQASFDELTAELEDENLTPGQVLKIQADADLAKSSLELAQTDLARVEALTVDAGTVIAGATLPTKPSSGGRVTKLLYGGVGMILGLMFGFVLAYLRETATDSVRGVSDLEEYLGAPVLGLVHKAKGRGKAPFMVHGGPDGTLLQDVRAIRFALLNTGSGTGPHRYLVTSSAQRDGRTTIAASLASVIASGDRRVILVSADLNAPALERLFGVEPTRDIVDVLEGRASLEEALIQTQEEGLWLVAARQVPAEARADLVESEAMGELLQAAASRADVVIVDSPPLVVADPLALASKVDGVIYVADADRAKRRRVARAAIAIEQAGGQVVGSVLNRFVPRRVRVGASQYRSEYRQRQRYLSWNGSGSASGGHEDVPASEGQDAAP